MKIVQSVPAGSRFLLHIFFIFMTQSPNAFSVEPEPAVTDKKAPAHKIITIPPKKFTPKVTKIQNKDVVKAGLDQIAKKMTVLQKAKDCFGKSNDTGDSMKCILAWKNAERNLTKPTNGGPPLIPEFDNCRAASEEAERQAPGAKLQTAPLGPIGIPPAAAPLQPVPVQRPWLKQDTK